MEQFDNPHSECEVRNSLWLDRLKQSLNESSWWVSEVDKVKAIIVLVPVIVLVLEFSSSNAAYSLFGAY